MSVVAKEAPVLIIWYFGLKQLAILRYFSPKTPYYARNPAIQAFF